MDSAIDFFPSTMRLFTNLVTVADPNFGSAGTSLRSALDRRLMSSSAAFSCAQDRGRSRRLPVAALSRGRSTLRPLRAVLGAALAAVVDAGGVERPADDVVPYARQVLHTASADQHDRVLLEVVPLAGDVRRH